MSIKRGLLAVVFTPVVMCLDAYTAVWYVDKDNTSGTEDGTSWATASNTIQEGIDAGE